MYGMGTSIERSSANTNFYTMGNFIPGIQVDGMDVLGVKEAVRFCRDYCSNDNGPIFLEAKTYRYHGHSMSDPGISYRDRQEVTEVRKTRDPIELTKQRIIDAGFATADELKKIEKQIRKEVMDGLKGKIHIIFSFV